MDCPSGEGLVPLGSRPYQTAQPGFRLSCFGFIVPLYI